MALGHSVADFIGFRLLYAIFSFSVYKKQLYVQTSQVVNLLATNVDDKLKRIDDLSFCAMVDLFINLRILLS